MGFANRYRLKQGFRASNAGGNVVDVFFDGVFDNSKGRNVRLNVRGVEGVESVLLNYGGEDLEIVEGLKVGLCSGKPTRGSATIYVNATGYDIKRRDY